jgi:signal transduction histidine kinase
MNIFELFKTTKPSGSGLGLPLVQQIVSAHNGTINYTSDTGHGTTFTIRLPAAARMV